MSPMRKTVAQRAEGTITHARVFVRALSIARQKNGRRQIE
jgi:hypothetical protein